MTNFINKVLNFKPKLNTHRASDRRKEKKRKKEKEKEKEKKKKKRNNVLTILT